MNRIFHPSLNYGDPNLSTQYLGNRTDIYFLDRCGAGKEDDDEDDDGFRYLLQGGGEGQCPSYPVHPRDCPFRALVYRGNTDRSNGDDCVGETNDIGPLADKARRSHIPIGIQNDRSVNWVVDLIGYPATNPTTGFHAFLTLALSCKTLYLYGYNCTGSADGHIAQLGWGNHCEGAPDHWQHNPAYIIWRHFFSTVNGGGVVGLRASECRLLNYLSWSAALV